AGASRARTAPSARGGGTPPGPARVGVGIERAQVEARIARAQWSHAGEREAPPLAVALLPVERGAPAARAGRGEAVREPELRPRIAPVADEGQVLGVGHRARRDLEGLDEDPVARRLVVAVDA